MGYILKTKIIITLGIERAIEIGAPASIIFDAKRQTGGVQVEVKGEFRKYIQILNSSKTEKCYVETLQDMWQLCEE